MNLSEVVFKMDSPVPKPVPYRLNITHPPPEPSAEKVASQGAKSLPQCFLAGTLVSRYNAEAENERELVPIETVREGDLVWSCDAFTGRWEPKAVLEELTHPYAGDIIAVHYEGGVIEVTGNHPIWIKSGDDLANRPRCEHIYDDEHEMQPHGRWVLARHLHVGDEFLTRSGIAVHVLQLHTREELTTVYNFTVDDYHTYAVGEFEVLVHNRAMERMRPRQAKWDDGMPTKPMTGADKDVLGEAKAAFDKKGGDFRRWFDANHKPKTRASNNSNRNPDTTDDGILEAFRKWIEDGRPKPK